MRRLRRSGERGPTAASSWLLPLCILLGLLISGASCSQGAHPEPGAEPKPPTGQATKLPTGAQSAAEPEDGQ